MRKVSILLADDEEAVVLSKDILLHIVDSYQQTGSACNDVDDMMAWFAVADAIAEQLKNPNYNYG